MTTATETTRREAATHDAGDRVGSGRPGPLPDRSDRVQRAFCAGGGMATPPAVALMRASSLSSGLNRMIDSVAQMQAEAARFGALRVHRALEAQARLLASRSTAAARETQQDYLRELAKDYARAGDRFFADGMRLAIGQTVPPPPEPDGERHATPV